MVNLMQERNAEYRKVEIPRIGHESFFVGILQGGDFFNRWTNSCRIVGTRRYGPDKRFADVKAEIEGMAAQVQAETGAEVALNFIPVREGWRVAESEPIVAALRAAYQEISGKALPLVGIRMVGDAPVFIREGDVPALYHGPQGMGAHADLEWVPVSELVRAAQVYVLTALRFAGVAGG